MKNSTVYHFLISLLITPIFLQAQAYDSLDLKLKELSKGMTLPGFSVGLVNENEVLFTSGYGWANMETQESFDESTLLNIGSVSKTFIAVAITQLIEEGKLSLDTPVNGFLPFKITNPNHPDVPITIRHLVTHSSGLKDRSLYYKKSYCIPESQTISTKGLPLGYRLRIRKFRKNKLESLKDFVTSYCSEDGKYHSKRNFKNFAPGSGYEYSNLGSALAAYIVELITDMDYGDYIVENVLRPIGMYDSGWRLKNINASKLSQLYYEKAKPLPHYELITYPDGGLRSNAKDLSIYLMKIIEGYKQGNELMSQKGFELMLNSQFKHRDEEHGIFWGINHKGDRGHTGGDPGITTMIRYVKELDVGIIMMTNVLLSEKGTFAKEFKLIYTTLKEALKAK